MGRLAFCRQRRWPGRRHEFRKQLETFAHLFGAARTHGWPVLRSIYRDDLPEAEDPFRAEDGLPDHGQLHRQHDDAGQQRDREQEPVLLEIGQRDQGDHKGGDDVAQRDRSE